MPSGWEISEMEERKDGDVSKALRTEGDGGGNLVLERDYSLGRAGQADRERFSARAR